MQEIKLNNLILVLGMHRSGTSCLTGILKEQGFFTGKLDVNLLGMNGNKGSQENREVFLLNEKLLMLNLGSWYNPQEIKIIPTDFFKKALDYKSKLRTQSNQQSKILIKDPRMLFCLNLWGESDGQYIGSFRHPSKVVASIEKRNKKNKNNKLSGVDWLEVWYKYNMRLLEEQERRKFPIVCFDWGRDVYIKNVSNIIENYLGRKNKLKSINFYDAQLRRNEQIDHAIPEKYQKVYNQLLEISNRTIEKHTIVQ